MKSRLPPGFGAITNSFLAHIDQEVRAARLAVVTEQCVRRILARVGDPESEPPGREQKRRFDRTRAQIALPPGSVVSRVTLWVNGGEREATFGKWSQVR